MSPDLAAMIAAHPTITHCPPAYGCHLSAGDILNNLRRLCPPDPDTQTIATKVHTRKNARTGWALPPSPMLDEIKQGRTVARMLASGVTRKELHRAVRAGWLVLGPKE